jgi:hypothetical protein
MTTTTVGEQGVSTETRSDQTQQMTPSSETAAPVVVEENNQFTTVTPVPEDQAKNKESRSDMRGLTVMLGGGIEGYSGDLAPQINAGPAWGVRAALKPTKVLGLEIGYSGAVNEIDDGTSDGSTGGADIVRNGGEAVATLGLSASPVQPYLLGGVGLSRYNVRGGEGAGFRSDTTGNIPLGGGLRTHVGNFTADARFGYSVLFDQQFASRVDQRDLVGINSTSGGRYQGTLNLGSTF